ncbi:orotate phosphoribosyltransferase [Bartonella sp. DGB1]|uniref:orotate phosphoribosyltransferase n=1 Tax=Bartonella sp. DGB1 TaxID=3239807 RepID=UPI003525A5FA
MNVSEVIDIFKESGGLLEGHFILTSGLHSRIFLQKARVFMYPDKTEKLMKALAEKVKEANWGNIDYLVAPAVGAIIPVYEMSRHMKVPAIWVEREKGQFQLRRFAINPGARVVVVEDIVTSGLSIKETIKCMQDLGAEVIGATSIIDRSAGRVNLGVPFIPLCEYDVPAYQPNDLPEDLRQIEAIKPGSRHL